jgi:WD40 repeat protein
VKEWGEPAPQPVPDGMQMFGAFSPLACACTPNGLRLARGFPVGAGDKNSLEVRIWDEKAGPFRVPINVDLYPDNIGRLVFDQDGTRLAGQYANHMSQFQSGLRVWDAPRGKELFTVNKDNPFTSLLAFSPDGSRVAWCNGVEVAVQDVGTGRVLLEVKDAEYCASFNADGSRIVWRDMTQHVHVWDVDAAREVLTIPDPGGEVGQLVFSPDDTRLAGTVGPGEVKVWDAGGREVLSLKDQGSVHDLAFSPDGRRLVTYVWRHDNDGEHPGVTVWDAVSGLPLLQLGVPDKSIETSRRLLFQPNGGRLFLVNLYPQNRGDAYVVWDATPTANEPRPEGNREKELR